jgi:PAS domain S-box-containing protein
MHQTPTIPSGYIAAGSDIRDLFHLFQKAPVGMVIYKGSAFVIEYINEKTLEIWERKKEEVLGRALFECFPELIGSDVEKVLKNVFTKGEKFHSKEFQARFFRGGKLDTGYFDFNAEPMQTSEGTITGVMIVITEITGQVTSRKKIEERETRLLHTKEQLELSIKAGRIGIWHWDVKNNVLTWSKEQKEMFGVADTAFKGKAEDFYNFVIPEDLQKVMKESKPDPEKQDNQYEFRIRRKDGPVRWIHSRSKTFFDLKNEPEYMTGINIDVTEQKTSEERIKESEEKYRHLSKTLEKQVKERTEELIEKNRQLTEAQQIAQLGSWSWNVANDEVIWSEEMYHIYGYNDERFPLTFEKALERMKPEDAETVRQRMKDHIAEGLRLFNEMGQREFNNPPTEYSITLPDGSKKMLRGVGKMILTKNGKVSKLIGTVQDISEPKKAEEELQLSEEKFMKAFQASPSGITITNTVTGKWIDVNESFLKMTGYTREEVVGHNSEELKLIDKEEREKILEEITSSGNLRNHEVSVKNKKGKILWVLNSMEKIIIKGEACILTILYDITERKKTEEEIRIVNQQLEKQNDFVETILNSSSNGITVYDKDLRFVKINHAAEKFINKQGEELIGKKITDVFPEIKDSPNYQNMLTALAGEYIHVNNYFSVISDRYFDSHLIPLKDADGKVYGLLTSGNDITESMKQMEELKKALEADKLKSDFIKMASHELKTPITSIKGYVQLLLAMVKEKEDEKNLSPLFVKSSLVNIEKQVNRLTRLMSELLDLSKIESGQLQLNREEFSVNELVIDVVQDVLYTNPKHQINVYHDFTSVVWADKDRIGQVIVNLLTNAIKYSPHADKIDVMIHLLEKNSVAISVKDFGIGIDKKDHEKIFERFYRSEGHNEQTYPGFGIGLFIAKETVKRHDGMIKVESEKGRGSVFTFTLPVTAKLQI